MGYYILENGQQYGPFTIEQLKKRGITTNTQVWREGMVQWTYVKNIPELIDIAQPPLPSGTPPPHIPYQQSTPTTPCPDNHLTLAIIATIVSLFACFPICIGAVSLIYALNVENKWRKGDIDRAEEYARNAKAWGKWSLIAIGIGYSLLIIFYIFIFAFSISAFSIFN